MKLSEYKNDKGQAVICIEEARLDSGNSPFCALQLGLLSKEYGSIAVDCSHLKLITSDGIGVLVGLAKQQAERGKGKLTLVGLNPTMKTWIVKIGLGKAFEFETLVTAG